MRALVLFVLLFACWRNAYCQIILDTAKPAFEWRLPLADLPFDCDAQQAEANRRTGGNARSAAPVTFADLGKKYRNLSMDQSMDMSHNVHGSLYYLNNLVRYHLIPPVNKKKYVWNRLVANATALGVDYLAIKLPYAYAFQHEEFHRSVMSVHGIYSYDEVWDFGKGLNIAVTSVKDDDLIFLKYKHPADQVRLSAAGVEGEYYFFQTMRKGNFYDKTGYPFVGLSIVGTMHAINYVRLPLRKDFDKITDSILARDQFNILARDFTGYDFSAWVYDLFTPAEPYTDRGIWPGGVGIRRPVKASQLTPEMVAFLKKAGGWQYLNLLSPFNVGINRIGVSENLVGNFALRSVPSSFGFWTGADVFLEVKERKWFISAGVNSSGHLTLPDLTVRYPELDVNGRWRVGLGLSAWLQPQDQMFFAKRAKAGFAVDVQSAFRVSDHLGIGGALKYKTAGWQFGNPYLDARLSGQVKLLVRTENFLKNK